jgi:hypothetical protein
MYLRFRMPNVRATGVFPAVGVEGRPGVLRPGKRWQSRRIFLSLGGNEKRAGLPTVGGSRF